jgi:pilus assembly protein CpaF
MAGRRGAVFRGVTEKIREHFDSPDHASCHPPHASCFGVILDNASTVVTGTLRPELRIAAMKTPVVDESVGVAASIRIVNPQSMTIADFVDGGTATAEMLDFLAACLRYGISICVGGATSPAKLRWPDGCLPRSPTTKRIFTIENGSRELALVREQDGVVTNSSFIL